MILARLAGSANLLDRKGSAWSAEEVIQRYDRLKACIHGSDAHKLADVGMPDQNRRTWVKGDATSESLRQACLEPKERVLVANHPPKGRSTIE